GNVSTFELEQSCGGVLAGTQVTGFICPAGFSVGLNFGKSGTLIEERTRRVFKHRLVDVLADADCWRTHIALFINNRIGTGCGHTAEVKPPDFVSSNLCFSATFPGGECGGVDSFTGVEVYQFIAGAGR